MMDQSYPRVYLFLRTTAERPSIDGSRTGRRRKLSRRRPPLPVLLRRHPGPGFALGHGDLDLGHHRGDLSALLDGVGAAFQSSQVEPLMRGDEIYHAGTSAGPIQAALEQHV